MERGIKREFDSNKLIDIEKELSEVNFNEDAIRLIEDNMREKYKDGRNTPELSIRHIPS